MGAVIIGALVGAAIAWLIATIRGPRFRHLGGGWFEEKPAKMGCFSHLLLTIVLAAIGALIRGYCWRRFLDYKGDYL